jgi:hypothetical protein
VSVCPICSQEIKPGEGELHTVLGKAYEYHRTCLEALIAKVQGKRDGRKK